MLAIVCLCSARCHYILHNGPFRSNFDWVAVEVRCRSVSIWQSWDQAQRSTTSCFLLVLKIPQMEIRPWASPDRDKMLICCFSFTLPCVNSEKWKTQWHMIMLPACRITWRTRGLDDLTHVVNHWCLKLNMSAVFGQKNYTHSPWLSFPIDFHTYRHVSIILAENSTSCYLGPVLIGTPCCRCSSLNIKEVSVPLTSPAAEIVWQPDTLTDSSKFSAPPHYCTKNSKVTR